MKPARATEILKSSEVKQAFRAVKDSIRVSELQKIEAQIPGFTINNALC